MLRLWADVTARTTTSVSTVRMGISSYPCFAAFSRWSRIRVSVSSWVHGVRPHKSHGTSVWYVLTTCLSVAMVVALAAKNEKPLYCCCQCRETRRRIHFPLLVRASAFKLSARCSSHTTSLMYGRNTWIVNKKMSATSGWNMLTIAASSRMTTCTTGVGELPCTWTRSSKQPPRSKSISRSSDAATSRALLYNVTRHWVRYLASYAIMSLALSFARRAVWQHTVWLEHQPERSMHCVKTLQLETCGRRNMFRWNEVLPLQTDGRTS